MRGPHEDSLLGRHTPVRSPRGIAVANGLVYIADCDANRIVVFKESDRTFVTAIGVENPQSLGVDPNSGAMYVCAATGVQTADLIKFSGIKGKELYRAKLPKSWYNRAGVHRIAVDASARPVRIWLPYITPVPTRL